MGQWTPTGIEPKVYDDDDSILVLTRISLLHPHYAIRHNGDGGDSV